MTLHADEFIRRFLIHVDSLQAQREACEAFIDSQRHEGWVCLRTPYDDGGFSGATMDRPVVSAFAPVDR